MTRKVILDCDPGHNDALTLMLVGASPEIDLAAVTTVAGNAEMGSRSYSEKPPMESVLGGEQT